jgi:DNA-binding transcriptional LysR family regulator
MIMDILSLVVFTEVAVQRSFTAAAARLNMPSSSVSNRVARLEQDLNVRLLNRSTRSVELTLEGEQILEKAREMLALAEEVQDFAQQSGNRVRGHLRVVAATPMSRLYMGNLLVDFLRRYPDVSVELIGDYEPGSFQERQIDFAFQLGPVQDGGLVARQLWDWSYGIYSSPGYLASVAPVTSLEKLAQCDCLVEMSGTHLTPWLLRHRKQRISFNPKTKFATEKIDVLRTAAVAGLGITYLPEIVAAEDIKKGRLVPILKSLWPGKISNYLVYRERGLQSARHRAFIDFFMEQRLAWQ